ncbi:hypothetical protein FB567DRAFT_174272 [Paraphoma chrysanthemicola]|uniref:Uncharacterized protein n=1 Tax=Paraphoma chrysanthemicola TaxID=798071 RepID=A0A8K0W346_9PLEO|nr:hypothetical protein FB567DRAFT_174272 [Paraphoma chrysanthemicola]
MRQFYSLTQVCRVIRHEFLPLYLQEPHVRIWLPDVPAYLETFFPEDYAPEFAHPIPGITVMIPLATKTFTDMSRLLKMARVAEVLHVQFESPFHFQLVMDRMNSLFGYDHFDGLMGNFKYFFPEDKPPADRKGRPIPRISRVLVRIGSPYRNHEGGIGTALEEQMLYHMDVSPEIWLDFEEEHSQAWMDGLNATFRCGNRSKQICWSELDGGEECTINFAKDVARRLGLHKIDITCWLHFGVDSPGRTAFRRMAKTSTLIVALSSMAGV